MELYDLLKFVLLPVMLCYIGFNERDKMSMKTKIENTSPRNDIEKLIDMKMQVHQVQIQDIKEDLERIEAKLDTILDRLVGK